jgi:hypothetical protein
MQTLDEKPETIHLYVVREEEPKPSVFPIVLSALFLVALFTFCALTPYQQPEIRTTIRVPAVPLRILDFRISIAVIPTGVKVYPATTAHGILTITNGSIISETLPKGMIIGNVTLDYSVFVPAGSANSYGYATVSAHALMSGKHGNIPAYGVDNVENASIYIRNLTAFHGGSDAYSVMVVTALDRQTALTKARGMLALQINKLQYPCKESHLQNSFVNTVIWSCRFITYSVPSYMHVIKVTIQGTDLLLTVEFIPPLGDFGQNNA